MLNYAQLQIAIATAKRRFDLIRQKYPELKAYLVLSLPGEQTDIDSSPIQILDEFPTMVLESAAKTNALPLLHRLNKLKEEDATSVESKSRKQEMKKLESQLDAFSPKFRYDEKSQIELRFHVLNYEPIWKLQADELVDRDLTPQTKASIRIVLGTLEHFISNK